MRSTESNIQARTTNTVTANPFSEERVSDLDSVCAMRMFGGETVTTAADSRTAQQLASRYRKWLVRRYKWQGPTIEALQFM